MSFGHAAQTIGALTTMKAGAISQRLDATRIACQPTAEQLEAFLASRQV